MSGAVGAILLILLALIMVLFAFGSAKVAGEYDDESERLHRKKPWEE